MQGNERRKRKQRKKKNFVDQMQSSLMAEIQMGNEIIICLENGKQKRAKLQFARRKRSLRFVSSTFFSRIGRARAVTFKSHKQLQTNKEKKTSDRNAQRIARRIKRNKSTTKRPNKMAKNVRSLSTLDKQLPGNGEKHKDFCCRAQFAYSAPNRCCHRRRHNRRDAQKICITILLLLIKTK